MPSPRRIAALGFVVACLITAAAALTWRWPAKEAVDSVHPHRVVRILDPTGYVPSADLPRFDHYLSLIRDETSIDLRLVFARPPQGTDISAAAIEAVEQLGVGRDTGVQRGLLLYFDLTAHRLKAEVGYGLEAYFPDAYVAFLVDRHAPLFFAAGDRSLGLRQLLRLLHARIRDATLGGDFDPSPFGLTSAVALSGGGGANSDLRNSTHAALPIAAQPRAISAGTSPAETYANYLKLLSAPDWDPGSDVFTDESRQYLRQFALSRAYRDLILQGEFGKSWQVALRGDLALLVFTGTPFASPHFFVRQGNVWRLDLVAEIRNTKERVGGPLTWSYEGTNDRYTSTFSDMIVVVYGYRRMANGDNRSLPTAMPAHR